MLLYFLLAFSAILVSAKFISQARYSLRKRKNGCQSPPSYPHYDPIWGIDLFFKKMGALKSGSYLESNSAVYELFKSKTFVSKSFGSITYQTIDSEVVKNYQSIYFKDFSIEPLRYHLAKNLWGNRIVVADGQRWASARTFIRSSFDVVHTANIARLNHHVEKMMSLIPRDRTTIDLMPLFKRLVRISISVRWTLLAHEDILRF